MTAAHIPPGIHPGWLWLMVAAEFVLPLVAGRWRR